MSDAGRSANTTHDRAFRRARLALVLAASLGALAWGAWLGQLHIAGRATPLDRLESALTDLRLRLAGPRTPPADLPVVAIDDATVRREGGFPVSRTTMARIIERVAEARPRVIAVDVLFLDAGRQPDADNALAAALAKTTAILASAAVFDGNVSEDGIPVATALHRPTPKLGEDVAAAVVLDEGSAATERGIRDYAAERLAPFKVPRKVVVLDEIPRGPTGKLQRIGLAETLGLAPAGDTKS